MFKQQYNDYNKKVYPNRNLVEKTIMLMEKNYVCNEKKHKNNKRIMLIAAVIGCCMLVAVFPVVAVNIDPLYQLMYAVSPSTAQFFKPVQKSCVKDGIEMTVVSSYIHSDTAEFYISLTDHESNRINENTDLLNNYSILTPFDCSSSCDFSSYNKDTKTAYFLVSISQWNSQKIEGDKLTFIVRNIVTNQKIYNNIGVTMDFSKLSDNPKTREITDANGNKIKVLVPLNEEIYSENIKMNNFNISGVGFIDGKLHIQTSAVSTDKNDTHGLLYLKNSTDKITPTLCYNFSEKNDKGLEVTYSESIFDLSQDKCKNYSLYAYHVTSDYTLNDFWSVTFPIENNTVEVTSDSVTEPNVTEETSKSVTDTVMVEQFTPKTKEDYLFKILNSVDYYNTVSGNIETNTLNGYASTIEYAVDMSENIAYEHTVEEETFDEEVFVSNGLIRTIDKMNDNQERIGKAYSKNDDTKNYTPENLRPLNSYRQNPTNVHYAATTSLFPQEFAYCFLYDTDNWEIKGNTKYEGRTCAVIEGKVTSDKQLYNNMGTSFSMLVDIESGILMKYEFFDYSGEITQYMYNKNISFDKPNVKQINS